MPAPKKKNTTKKTTKPTKKVAKNDNNEQSLAKIESTFLPADNFGGFLSEQDELVAHYLAKGYSDKEVKEKFGIKDAELDKLRKDPTFVKFYNDKVMGTGMANKVNRVSKAKRALSVLSEEFFKRVEDGQLEKESLSTVWRMMQEAGITIDRLMGEDKVADTNINILIKEVIKERTNKEIDNFIEYDPKEDYKVIDVTAIEIKPEENE